MLHGETHNAGEVRTTERTMAPVVALTGTEPHTPLSRTADQTRALAGAARL